MHLGLHWWEHSWLLHKVFCCGLVLVFFGDLVVSKKRRIWSVFDFVPVRLSTISYLYSWIGLWTLNLLRFSVIYLLCTGFLSLSIFWQGRCHSAWHQLLRARNSSSPRPPPPPWEIRDFKQQRWRRLAKRHLKSEFALLETLSRLFHVVQFVKCWQIFLELSSKGLYQSPGKEKENCCLVFPSSTKRDARAKLLFWQYKPSAFLPFSLTSWSSLLKLPKDHHIGNYVLYSPGRGTWVNFWWVCAAGLSEPLLHYSLFCGQL